MTAPLKTIAEAAEHLGIPASTLRDYVTARKVQHTRIGRHVRFSEDDLAAIVASGVQRPVTVPPRLQVVHPRPVARTNPRPPAGPSTPPPPSGPKKRVA